MFGKGGLAAEDARERNGKSEKEGLGGVESGRKLDVPVVDVESGLDASLDSLSSVCLSLSNCSSSSL